MTKKKVKHRKRKNPLRNQRGPQIGLRGSDRLFVSRRDRAYAILLVIMGIFQIISQRMRFIRVFEYFFEVRHFQFFAGVGVAFVLVGAVFLFRKWITWRIRKVLAVILTAAFLFHFYLIQDFVYYLLLVEKMVNIYGESSATVTAIWFTTIVYLVHAIVLIFCDLNLIFGYQGVREAVLVFMRENKEGQKGYGKDNKDK